MICNSISSEITKVPGNSGAFILSGVSSCDPAAVNQWLLPAVYSRCLHITPNELAYDLASSALARYLVTPGMVNTNR